MGTRLDTPLNFDSLGSRSGVASVPGLPRAFNCAGEGNGEGLA